MNNNEIKKKVAIYCRLACKDNEEIKKQEKMLLDYCKNKNYEVYKSYIDNGYGANNKTRPSYSQMLIDLKQNKFDKIVALKLDRISRNLFDFIKITDLMKEYNCGFEFMLEKIDTTTHAGKMLLDIFEMGSKLQRD